MNEEVRYEEFALPIPTGSTDPTYPDDPLNQKQYWKSQKKGSLHGPENYIHSSLKTQIFFEELLRHVEPQASFLEIGCNSGVNLNYLWQNGFKDIAGIDINETAIHKVMPEQFPEMVEAGRFSSGDAVEEIKQFSDKEFDVVFAKGVLVHIPPGNKSLFEDMARIAKTFILIFEDDNNPALYRYDFERIFSYNGYDLAYKKTFYGVKDWSSYPQLEPYKVGLKKKSIQLFVRRVYE